MFHEVVLILAGFSAGVINAVAGGGSLIIYPLLLSLGLAPVTANATSAMIVWPGAISSALGYRKYISSLPRHYFALLVPALIGGLIGAVLLGQTSNRSFEAIVPWFMVLAVVLLSLQPRLHRWLYSRAGKRLEKRHRTTMFVVVNIALLVVAIYGGYFGAGFGIVMLAFIGLTELTNIHQMNGLKNLSAICVNLTALAYFIFEGLIDWQVIPLLLVANVAGGWVGSTYSAKLPTRLIRAIILTIGIIVAGVLFAKRYF